VVKRVTTPKAADFHKFERCDVVKRGWWCSWFESRDYS